MNFLNHLKVTWNNELYLKSFVINPQSGTDNGTFKRITCRSSRSGMFFKIGVFKKFRNIHRKTPVLQSLFDKVAALHASNVIKNRLKHWSVDSYKVRNKVLRPIHFLLLQ